MSIHPRRAEADCDTLRVGLTAHVGIKNPKVSVSFYRGFPLSFLFSNSKNPAIETVARRIGRKTIGLSHPKRGGRGIVVGAAVASLAVAGTLAAGAPAASASTARASISRLANCSWHPLSLINGWRSEQSVFNSGNPSYCVTSNGMVYLSGSLAQPGGGSDEVAVLPAAARPASNLYLSVYTFGGTTGVLFISTAGDIEAFSGAAGGGDTAFTSLAGISFPGTTVAQQPLSLLNGWQSAQSQFGTGDPSYSVTSDQVVHLSGSLNGSQITPGLSGFPGISANSPEKFAVLPPGDGPAACSSTETYTFGGVPGVLAFEPSGELDAYATGLSIYNTPSAGYTSLASISFPEASWAPSTQALTLNAGWSASIDSGCANSNFVGPGYTLIGGVVYLSGDMISSGSPNGTFATLPLAARPTHTLYLTMNEGPADPASLEIDPNGNMTVFASGAATGVNSLTGLSYQVSS
jgi:hypothetical protein